MAVDGAIGYVNVGPEDDRYLRATKTPWEATFGSMAGVVSDGNAYLAYGSHAQFDYGPYELHGLPALALRSLDGVTWNPLEAGPEWSIKSVAPSEAGWVAIIEIPLGGTLMTYSADGQTWEPGVGVDEGMSAVAHGPAGWVATGDSGSWTSVDGQSWDGPHAIGRGIRRCSWSSSRQTDGYVGFDRFSDRLFTSVDGRAWAANDHGGFRISDAELAGDQVWVVVADEDGRDIRPDAVRSAPEGSPGAPRRRASAVRASMSIGSASGPEGMLAVGWDEAIAGGDRVALDGRWRHGTASHLDPTRWIEGRAVRAGLGRRRAGSARSSSARPMVRRGSASEYELGYDGPVPPCPPAAKVSTIVLSYLGRFAADCFGESSMTIRGWVGELGFGGCCPPDRRARVAGIHVPAGDPLLGRPGRRRCQLPAHRLRAAGGRP